jgi:hypothetical protein
MTSLSGRRPWASACAAAALLVTAGAASAQPPDARPQPSLGALFSIGGEVSATYGSNDPGFFNYATYAYDPLQNVRVVFDASVRPLRAVEVLAQVRTDGISHARMAALYVRVRPWAERNIDLQAGRVPTVFGLFGRSGYSSDSPLISRPLAYAYLLSLRRDAVPATAADLLRMRGRGWLSAFALGNQTPDRGLPIVNTDTWDSGVQVRVAHGPLEWAGSVTAGSLGSPRLRDDNGGRSWSSRATVRLHPSVVVGGSASRGAYLSRSLATVVADGGGIDRFHQRAFGVDVEVAGGPWLARGEVLTSRWDLPAFVDGTGDRAVSGHAAWSEIRLRTMPGFDVALRVERLGFGDVSTPTSTEPWESPVTRFETGVAYVPIRNVRVKVDAQRNRRPLGGRVRHDTLFAAQVSLWF